MSYDETESLIDAIIDAVHSMAQEGLVASHADAIEAVETALAFLQSAPEVGSADDWWKPVQKEINS